MKAKDSRFAVALWLLATAPCVWPQAHERTFPEFVLRSSVTSSENISAESARIHGIERAPDIGVLNVTVLRRGSRLTETLPALVQAEAMNLGGIRRPIAMRETATDGWVSYTGTFKFAPREVLDFTIRAQPLESGTPLEMTYRKQLWRGDRGE